MMRRTRFIICLLSNVADSNSRTSRRQFPPGTLFISGVSVAISVTFGLKLTLTFAHPPVHAWKYTAGYSCPTTSSVTMLPKGREKVSRRFLSCLTANSIHGGWGCHLPMGSLFFLNLIVRLTISTDTPTLSPAPNTLAASDSDSRFSPDMIDYHTDICPQFWVRCSEA